MTDLLQRLRAPESITGFISRATLMADRIAAADEIEQLRIELHAGRSDVLRWAVARWFAEVSQRPIVNVHRRTLDDCWRQVIRYCGGDDIILCGPRHDDLLPGLGDSNGR